MKKEISVRLNLKSKEDGKLLSVHPPISSKQNGIIEFPVEIDKWEVVSIDRNSEIKIKDITDREWEVFENDEITVMGQVPKVYKIIFKEGMFGIEADKNTLIEDFVLTFLPGIIIDNIRDYYYQKFMMNQDKNLFISLSHLNIGELISVDDTEEKIPTILLTKS